MDDALSPFTLSAIVRRPSGKPSLARLALQGARVVDIEFDVLAGKRRHGHLRRALRRVKAMPCALRNDGDHSGAKLEGLGRPVIADNFQGLRTVENVNQLVVGVCFPMTCPCGLAGDEDTVAIRAQLRPTAPALRPLCLRCQSAEHGELGEFGVEIDDAGRFAFHVTLPNRLVFPYVVKTGQSRISPLVASANTIRSNTKPIA